VLDFVTSADEEVYILHLLRSFGKLNLALSIYVSGIPRFHYMFRGFRSLVLLCSVRTSLEGNKQNKIQK
jgi:hypothetical protein